MKRFLIVFIISYCFVVQGFSQTVLIEGSVTGMDKKPMEDAYVSIPAKGISTITDRNGKYQITGNFSGNLTIRVSYSGYKTNEQQISVVAGQKNKVDFVLEQAVIDLNAIVVTATRSGRPLKDVPIHTQVVYGSELQKTDANSLSDALVANFPGIDSKNLSAGSGGKSLQMNGFGNQYILILVDGERLNPGDTKENVDLSRINTESIDRIEIVRGASSALYGSDAIAGVINIITKKNTKTCEGSLGSRFSDYGEQRHFLDLGLKSGGLTSRTSFIYNKLDGWDINPEEAGKTVEATKNYSIDQRLGYQFSDRLNLTGDFSYFRRVDNNTTPLLPDRRYEDYNYRLMGNYKLSDHHQLEGVWYTDHYMSYDLDLPTVGQDHKHYDKTFNTARLQDNIKLTTDNTLVAGVEYNKDELFSANGLSDGKKAQALIVYVENVWDIAPRLTAVAGGRMTFHSEYHANATWQLAMNYRPGEFSLRGSFGRGFRAPTLKELYMDFNIPGAPIKIIGNQILKPENSNYLSLSAEYSHANFSASVIGQYNDLNNLITEVFSSANTNIPPFVYQYQNITKAEMLNMEVLLNYRPVPQIKISGGYTWTKPLTSRSEDAIDRFEARQHSAVMTGEYSALSGKYRPTITLQGKYYGDANITWTNNRGQNSKVKLSEYFNWKLTTLHRITRWASATAGIDNLFNYTDPRYFTSMSPGRRLFAGVKFNW
ncbi:MAG: TonB-dependent receptor [Bacteroidia bacterium]|nr:TonB-dependent receptor [Bacteroidia bacterium]